jgi:hypothetical protein
MVYRGERLKVGVHNQVLWVGAEAYPVHNIARARTIVLRPRRGRAVFRFLGYVVLWIVLGFAGAVAINNFDLPWRDANLLSGLPFIVGALILINLIALIRTLATRTLYALDIETSGSPHTALVSEREDQLTMIMMNIMDAINNPHLSYGPVSVQQINAEKIGMIGDHGHIGAINM